MGRGGGDREKTRRAVTIVAELRSAVHRKAYCVFFASVRASFASSRTLIDTTVY